MSTSAGRRSSSNSGRGGRGSGAPKESAAARNAREIAALHEASAKWQAEHPNAPRELQPTHISNIEPVKTNVAGIQINIAAPINIPAVHEAYGSHQLGAVLHAFSSGRLKEALDAHGPNVPRSGGHDALISRITAAATHGHYSANFPKESAKSASSKTTSRTSAAPTRTKPVNEMSRDEMIAHINALEAALAGRSRGSKGGGAQSARGSTPSSTPTPIRPPSTGEFNPYGKTSAYDLMHEYGTAQFRAVLGLLTQRDLREAVTEVMARNPGTRPANQSSKQVMIDWLVTHTPAED